MGFAGIHDLKLSGALGNLAQAIQIGKNQVRAFVSRGAASKADGERFGIEGQARFLAHGFKKLVLGK